jgi:type III secretory pathway component EscV
MLPVIVFVAIALPLLVLAFLAVRRSKASGEHPVSEDDATRQRTEDEFAAAEAYQDQWREEEKKHPRDTIV